MTGDAERSRRPVGVTSPKITIKTHDLPIGTTKMFGIARAVIIPSV